jgi:hypothetical protein
MSYHNHGTIFDMAQRCAFKGLAEDLDQLRVCAATCIPKQMRHTTDIAHATTPARNRVVPEKPMTDRPMAKQECESLHDLPIRSEVAAQ